jgi:hypothetical protein
MASENTLLRNRGDGTFEDTISKAGANPVGWCRGASFADFDNDGWLDIYAADGWVKNDPGTDLELEFLNNVVSHQDIDKTVKYFVHGFLGENSWHGWERNTHLRNNGDRAGIRRRFDGEQPRRGGRRFLESRGNGYRGVNFHG